MKKKKCALLSCHCWFWPKKANSAYCSDECRNEAERLRLSKRCRKWKKPATAEDAEKLDELQAKINREIDTRVYRRMGLVKDMGRVLTDAEKAALIRSGQVTPLECIPKFRFAGEFFR